jgi:predicted DNA-binding transcriptional regulator AlpA
LKARQAAKIKQLGEALVAAGFCTLDDQAKVLGLSRSTTWTILKANHKSSGLSASVINRMSAAPALPPRVKLTIAEYIEEKRAGLYGDGDHRVRRFAERIEKAVNGVRSFK